MGRYRFLLSPRWIVLTVLVGLAVLTMIYLGLWQVSRLQGRREANAVIEARMVSAPVGYAEAVPPGAAPGVVDDATFRPVTMTGTYRPEDQVLIRNRAANGAPGFWVVTPLAASDGAVLVNRGWIPITVGDGGDPASYAPPAGTVTVTGIVRATEQREGLAAADPDGRQATLSRVDVPRIQEQVPYPVGPSWVQLTSQTPAQPTNAAGASMPVVIDLPALDEGPHLGYAGQWFIFALLTCTVYPLVMRRVARERERSEEDEADGDGDAGDAGVDGDGHGGAGPHPADRPAGSPDPVREPVR